jgi:hypothetical protein
MTVRHNRIIRAQCAGVAVAGVQMIITGNLIEANAGASNSASQSWCNNPFDTSGNSSGDNHGAGIYAEGGSSHAYNPVIGGSSAADGNTIRYNTGNAIDVNQVDGGEIRNNVIYDNHRWAAVSLYGAQNWTISANNIHQPYNGDSYWGLFHPECVPPVNYGSAILLCSDLRVSGGASSIGNTIANNYLDGYYGIVAIGDDDTSPAAWVPYSNTFSNNDTQGSYFGSSAYCCIDDDAVYQRNLWTANICVNSLQPSYF